MKNCLIVINKFAGTSKKINFDKVKKCLGDDYDYTHLTIPSDNFDKNRKISFDIPEDLSKFDAIAVCGGDGTLGSILHKVCKMPLDLFYFPVGTLNDKAKSQRYEKHKSLCPTCKDHKSNAKPVVYGKVERILPSKSDYQPISTDARQKDVTNSSGEDTGSVFAYVFAAGSFTPIGYTSNVKNKKKFGVLAYLAKVIEQYKPHRINASIKCDNHTHEGEFTLIMFVKSPRCFGFHFNKAFDGDKQSGHLVAIRAPKHRGLLGYIEMFFPFFRVFFMGLKKERISGTIIFEQSKHISLTLKTNVDFCRDGEKQTLDKGEYSLVFQKSICNFSVIEKF